MESQRNRDGILDGIDGIATDFRQIFCRSFVRVTFRRNSVVIPSIPRIFHESNGFLTEPGLLFLHVSSMLGPN